MGMSVRLSESNFSNKLADKVIFGGCSTFGHTPGFQNVIRSKVNTTGVVEP